MARLSAAVAVAAVLACVAARTCEASIGFPYPLLGAPRPSPSAPGLTVGYYSKYTTCKNAEDVVSGVVKKAVADYPGVGAGLIRLFFHDCFVQGCDASVLLQTTPSGETTEMYGPPNANSLRGFEVIDAAKAALNALKECQGVVSCADIVAFAARDATAELGKDNYWFKRFDMPSGRYDGRVSRADETVPNLPPPFGNLMVLKTMFANKGFTTKEMVTLSGAHSIGRSHCSSFSDHLPPRSSDMNAEFAASLTATCSSPAVTVDQDHATPDKLDVQYYKNVKDGTALFKSDAALLTSDETRTEVEYNIANLFGRWEWNFMEAMVKMGNIDVKNKTTGEIRSDCRFVNY